MSRTQSIIKAIKHLLCLKTRFHLKSHSATGLLRVGLFDLLGFKASATARVISRRNDGDETSFLVEETGVPGGYHTQAS